MNGKKIRSSRPEVFCKKGVVKNLKILAEACNFIKKETLALVFSCQFCKIFKNTFFYWIPMVTASVKYEYTVNARFTQECYNCFSPSLVKKHLSERIIFNFFFISYWEKFLKFVKFIFIAIEFIAYLSHIFCLPKKPQELFFQVASLEVSSVLINCTMWASNLFSASSFFPRFSRFKFFWIQVLKVAGFWDTV